MAYERIEREGVCYAEILTAGTSEESSKFYSPASSSFQLGVFAHGADFQEPAHSHHPQERTIRDVQQLIVLKEGRIAVDFFTPEKTRFKSVELGPGDAIVLVHGAHGIRILQDAQGISLKQGPFLGDEHDKVFL